jgi:hypothetical protein
VSSPEAQLAPSMDLSSTMVEVSSDSVSGFPHCKRWFNRYLTVELNYEGPFLNLGNQIVDKPMDPCSMAIPRAQSSYLSCSFLSRFKRPRSLIHFISITLSGL